MTAPLTVSTSSALRARAGVVANVVPPALHTAEAAAGVVFGAIRRLGPVARDAVAQASGLSIATVNRQVSALLEAELVRERPDLVAAGAIGRPRVPVEVNHEPYLTVGIHVGARTTSMVAADLFGRTLGAVETPTATGPPSAALSELADSARRYLGRWHRRRPLWVGVATGGVVDGSGGYVDHARLGWAQAPLGPVLARALALPVSVASHVDAMAAAELLLGGSEHRDGVSSLYLYARETVGFAQVIEGRVHTPLGGPGTIAGLPVRSELLGGSGRLESTVSDEAVMTAARAAGILPATGPKSSMAELLRAARREDGPARELLDERARILGGATALLRDMLNPESVVVGGQAFTDYPDAIGGVQAVFNEQSLLGEREIRPTRFGGRVQEAGAGMVALSNLYADPIGALRRARNRSASSPLARRETHRVARHVDPRPVGRIGRPALGRG